MTMHSAKNNRYNFTLNGWICRVCNKSVNVSFRETKRYRQYTLSSNDEHLIVEYICICGKCGANYCDSEAWAIYDESICSIQKSNYIEKFMSIK